MDSKKRYLTIVLLLTLIFTMMVPTHRIKADERKTVRVGVFPLGKFHDMDEDGNPVGYDIDYLTKISQNTHWKIEYVESGNWTEALKQLDQGEIDLLAPAQMTPERLEKYEFSAYAMGNECGAVYISKDQDDVLFEDYDKMGKFTYGVPKDSPFIEQFQNYCNTENIHPEVKEYADMTSSFDAARTGEVDAVITNIMFAEEDLKLIGKFTLKPVYYICTKENEGLMDELDDAMTSILAANPSYQTELTNSYFPIFNNTEMSYEERQFIKDYPEIKIGYAKGRSPVSYMDKNGEFAGMTRDILERISEISGIKFRYIPLENARINYDYLVENNISVVSGIEYNEQNTSTANMQLGLPYLSSEKVIVAKEKLKFNENSEMLMGICSGSENIEISIHEIYPNFTIKHYDSVEDSFQSVYNGEMDMTMTNRYVAERLLAKPLYTNMSVIPIQAMTDQLSLATIYFDQPGNVENTAIYEGPLLSIIDKAIRQISTTELNSIIIENTAKDKYQLTFVDLLFQSRFFIFVSIIIIILILLFQRHSNQLKMKQNEILSKKNLELSDAIEQAQKASMAKSQFLAKMSHEIRTPMNAIVGITTIAKKNEQDPQKIDDYLTKIDSSSKVLLNIINDVLDMSAIESDKIKIAKEPFDIKALLSNITNIYYTQCKSKGIGFEMQASEVNTEMLKGDQLRINQILLNLISNAFKFTETGKITVIVQETARREGFVYLRFTVSDTGCGMGPDMLERIFKPFEQENAVIAQKHGGSGLGLSIAKNLVEMMQGAISVESEKGKGTTFTVDIPFEPSDQEIDRDPGKLKNLKILIVDDIDTEREYTSIVLERIGVKYEIARSGKEAIRMLKESYEAGNGYDICFVDWKMPDISGVEVTKQIREIFDEDTVIIIVSAYDLSEVEDEAKAAGANMFIPKPLFQSTVFDLLMNMSGGKYTKYTDQPDNYDFKGMKILLAEDNALNAEIAQELLELVNMKLDHAVNGAEAVEMFEAAPENTYVAILMDVQMPVMNGHEAAKTIRASNHPEAKSIPIYAMTANAFTEDVSASLSAGMNGHIAKPIDTGILYSTLQKVVDRRNSK